MEEQKKGFRLLIVVGILWLVIIYLTSQHKALFVEESGNFKLFGRDLFPLLMLGLFCRIKLLKDILVIMFIIQSLILYVLMSMEEQYIIQFLAYLLLIALSLVIAAILNNSSAVRVYFQKERKMLYSY